MFNWSVIFFLSFILCKQTAQAADDEDLLSTPLLTSSGDGGGESSTTQTVTADSQGRVWKHQIRCTGALPRSQGNLWSAESVWGRNWKVVSEREVLPRRLCAKRKYGGSAYGSLPGYCADKDYVLDSYDAPADRTKAELYRQVVGFCQQRCRCIDSSFPGAEYNTIYPAREIVLWEDHRSRTRFDYNPIPITLDRGRVPAIPSREDGYYGVIPIKIAKEESLIGNDPNYAPISIRLTPRSGWVAPICNPTKFPEARGILPYPFVWQDFPELKHLCNAQVFGGNRRGNAGYVCAKFPSLSASSADRDKLHLIAVDSETHPAFQYTQTGSYLWDAVGQAMSLWCFSYCTCDLSGQPPWSIKQKDKFEMTNTDKSFTLIAFPAGGVYQRPFDKTGNPTGSWQTLIPGTSMSGRQMGNLRPSLANIESLSRPKVEGSNLVSCTSTRDCYNTNACGSRDCQCVANPSLPQRLVMGLQPFIPILGAVCVSNSAVRARLPG